MNASNEIASIEAEESNPQAETDKAAPRAAAARAGWSPTGALALLIALGAAGGAGYLWWLQQQQQGSAGARLDDVSQALAKQAGELGELRAQLAANAAADGKQDGAIDALNSRAEQFGTQLDDLTVRTQRLERSLEELPGISDKARNAWLISEAEYYLNIANAQVQLARNPQVALRALQLADEKLRDAGDPKLTPVRALLADEMTALRAVPQPDIEGLMLAISSLARALPDLPLAREAPQRYGQGGQSGDKTSGLARAWSRIVEAVLGLVRIKRTDEAAVPLRTPAEEALLLRRLEAELELARGALLNGRTQLYRSLLDDVKNSLRREFDDDAPAVRAAINQLADLSRTELPDSLPDISGSLDLLMQLSPEASAP